MKYSKLLQVALLFLAVSAGLVFLKTGASLAFTSNNLMDDGVFDNTSSMSASAIDSWLNSNFPNSCISTNNGFSAPDPISYSPSTGFTYGGPVSGGHVIYDAAVAYGLNPQVLLATLQKEESLVDGSAGCSTLRISASVGYGCPDGGTLYSYSNLNPPLYYSHGIAVSSISNTCVKSAADVGFAQQLIHAAWLFKFGEQRSQGNTNWNVQGNNVPEPGDHWDNSDDPQTCYGGPMTQGTFKRCSSDPSATFFDGYTTIDGQSVHMDTGATAALYWYTPHFSGNHSFDSVFAAYFGSIYAQPYANGFAGESSFPAINPAQAASVYLEYQNLGSKVWYDDQSIGSAPAGSYPVHLATSNPLNRNSGFASGWPSASRPAVNFSAVYESDGTTLAANQHVAQPGQIVKFGFNVKAADWVSAGTYNEYFQPVAEGSPGLFNDSGSYIAVTLNPVTGMNWYAQSGYPTIYPSESQSVSVSFKNSGDTKLYDSQSLSSAPSGTNPLHLAISCPINSSSPFATSGWPSASRPAVNFSAVYESDGTTLAANQHVAQPGQIVKFGFNLSVPNNYSAGTNKVCFQPILEGTSDGYFPDMGVFLNLTVPSAAVITYTNLPSKLSMVSGELKNLGLQIKNVGNATLAAGSSVVTSNGSAYQASNWSSAASIQTIASDLSPSASSTLSLPFLAPTAVSTRTDNISLQINDASNTTVRDSSTSLNVSVSPPIYSAGFAGQSAYPSFTYGQVQSVYFLYKNTGNKPWYDDTSVATTTVTRNPLPTHLATASPMNRNSGFASGWPSASRPAVNFSAVYESDGTTLAANQHVAQPGQIVKFGFNTAAQAWVNPGTYTEYFQPIIETMPDGAINNLGTYLAVKLNVPQYNYAFSSQSAYPTINSGQSTSVFVAYKNTGTAPWYDDTSYPNAPANSKLFPVHLATSHPLNRSSNFASGWPSASRPAVNFSAVYESDGTTLAANQHVAQPGQIVKFGFSFAVPSGTATDTYKEYFQPVAEGSSTGSFSDQGTFLQINVP